MITIKDALTNQQWPTHFGLKANNIGHNNIMMVNMTVRTSQTAWIILFALVASCWLHFIFQKHFAQCPIARKFSSGDLEARFLTFNNQRQVHHTKPDDDTSSLSWHLVLLQCHIHAWRHPSSARKCDRICDHDHAPDRHVYPIQQGRSYRQLAVRRSCST